MTLDASAVQRFVASGFHVVGADEMRSISPDFHRGVAESTERALAAGRTLGGNDSLEALPQLRTLLADHAVHSALISLFGEGWRLYQHAAMHDGGRRQGKEAQELHKDGPICSQARFHRPRWGMLLYYPQAVRPDMGPTAVIPSSQYLFQQLGNPYVNGGLPKIEFLTVPAGTLVITHYELFHGASEHLSDTPRLMHKLLVVRGAEPVLYDHLPVIEPPFWEALCPASSVLLSGVGGAPVPLLPLRAVWTSIHRWLTGSVDHHSSNATNGGAYLTPEQVAQFCAELQALQQCSTNDSNKDSCSGRGSSSSGSTTTTATTTASARTASDALALAACCDPRVSSDTATATAISKALEAALINSTDEVVRLNAVYGLGALERVELLLASLHKDVLASQQQVAPELAPPPQVEGEPQFVVRYDGSRGCHFTNPAQLDAVYGLAAAGLAGCAAAVSILGGDGQLSTCLKNGVECAELKALRACGAQCLAEMGSSACVVPTTIGTHHDDDADADGLGTLKALTAAVTDENEWVARNAAVALGTFGAATLATTIVDLLGPHPLHLTSTPPNSAAAAAACLALLDAVTDTDEGQAPVAAGARITTEWSLGTQPLREIACSSLVNILSSSTTSDAMKDSSGCESAVATVAAAVQALAREAAQSDPNEYVRYWLGLVLPIGEQAELVGGLGDGHLRTVKPRLPAPATSSSRL